MPDIPPTYGRRKPRQRQGGSVLARNTSAAYRRQRIAILDHEPLCRYCRARGRIAAATILDHVIALSLGGSNDPSNLAPSCASCNSEKAADEQRYLARGYDVSDLALDSAMAKWLGLALATPSNPV